MKGSIAKPDKAGRVSFLPRYIPVMILLFAGIALSIVVYRLASRGEWASIESEFEELADNHIAALSKGVGSNMEIIRGIKALFIASQEVERVEFKAFVKVFLARHAEIQAMEWIPRVRDSERETYEEAARKDGLAGFQISKQDVQGQMVRDQKRAEYFPVYYVEPLEGNETAVGFNLASDSFRLEALERARDTGAMVATARIILVQETGKQFGFLLFQPIYSTNIPHATIEQRRANLTGFALVVFRIGDLVKESLKGIESKEIDIHIYDQTAKADQNLLYSHGYPPYLLTQSPMDQVTMEEENYILAGIHIRVSIDVADRQWIILLHPTQEFIDREKTMFPAGVLVGGLLLTALITVYLLGSLRHRNMLESEILQRKRAEEESRLLQVLTQVIGESKDFIAAMDRTLRLVGETTGWSLGEAWVPSRDGTLLEYSGAFYSNIAGVEEFRKVSQDLTFAEGVGLPGQAWSSRHAVWVSDVTIQKSFLRGPIALEIGLKTATAIPLISAEEVIAVMLFFMTEQHGEDERFIELISAVASQLGQVFRRKQAEEQQQKLSALVENSTDFIGLASVEGRMSFINKAGLKLVGLKSIEESPTRTINDYFSEKDVQALRENILPAMTKNGLWQGTFQFRHFGTGKEIPIEMSAFVIKHSNTGKPIAMAAVCRDITEILKYQTNLERMVEERTTQLNNSLVDVQKARDRIDGILKSVADGLIVTDMHNKIVLMNIAAEDLLAVRLSDVIDNLIDFAITDSILRERIRATLDKKTSGSQFDFELAGEDPEHPRIMRARTSVINDREGKESGIVTIMHDVTHEREVDRMKTEFISTAAHELRTPLTSIQGFSEILLTRDNLGEDEKEKFLGFINKQAVGLAKIISDLLDISRIESGKGFILDKKWCNAGDAMKKVVYAFQEASKRHRFEVILPEETTEIFCDKDKIEQVLENLLSNAVKYSPEGGVIRYRAEVLGGFFQVAIEDQGVGMSPEQVEKIFDKFYRVDASNTAAEGTGLRLSIVKYIVEAHGGKVWVESEPGKGTIVRFAIPMTKK